MTIPKALSALVAEVRSWRDERSTVRHLSIQNSGVTTSLCINVEVSPRVIAWLRCRHLGHGRPGWACRASRLGKRRNLDGYAPVPKTLRLESLGGRGTTVFRKGPFSFFLF
jgi:hypothetical protein